MSKVYRDVFGNEIPDPEPVDEQPEPEIRGGNRREDYLFNAEQARTPSKETNLISEDDEGYGEDDGDEE